MRKYPTILFVIAVFITISASGVFSAALVRDIAEAAYGELLDADLLMSVGSTVAEVESADVGPAELSSELTGPDSNAVNKSLEIGN